MENEKYTNEFLVERFRSLFDNMPSCCAIYTSAENGSDFLISDFNTAAEIIENVQREGIIGKSIKEIFPGVIEFGLFEVLQRVWKTGKPEHFPIKLYKDERISGWKDNYIYKLSSGEIVVIYSDVTEKKKMEEDLEKSRSGYKEILENNIDGIVVVNEKGKFVWLNKATTKMFEIKDIESLKDKVIFDFIDPQSITNVIEDFKMVMGGKREGFLSEYSVISTSGKKYWVEAVGRKTIFENKVVDWITFRNITERKNTEEKIHAKTEELERLNKLMIGRELKMIELKKEMEELKIKCSNQ